MGDRVRGRRVLAAVIALSGLSGACGTSESESSSVVPPEAEQECPVIGLSLPTPVAVTGGGTVATMVQELSGLALIEAELLQALPCSFSQLVVTPDQRGFVVYATELTDDEQQLVESIVDGIDTRYELRGIEQARAARPAVERAKQRLYAAVPIDLEISLSADRMGDITVSLWELPAQTVDDDLVAIVVAAVADVDAEFAGEVKVVAEEPLTSFVGD